ncbi:hypothetical protein OU995_11195 [Roseateles sp. SL47]|jgi:hypothetical protein|uniref:hypothetical protein n=1 Tax=Roseateles sp. SL47 TaxID=2995138 RepID=UPI00226E8436|nr:hypothetical protein [Roseateles sp. SL47]WAC75221.1 hypothetical protein OU995_11195 [Roseateles sp. SL47]
MNPNELPLEVKTPAQEERGGVLGFALICVLAVLTVAALRAPADTKNLVMGVYLMVWGCMFIASYFFSHKTFFLRGLLWFCVTMACPSTPKMAFFYGFMGLGMGAVSLMAGLGLI